MNNKKKIAAVTTMGALAFSMLGTAAIPVKAASDAEYTKNENVYVRMEQDGSQKGTYVVNSFTITKAGEITDIGDYDRIYNLTDLSEIEQDKDEQVFDAEEGKFYYQGDIEKAEIPWNFDITYILDGTEVEKEELEGAEGDLIIKIQVRKNPSMITDSFFNGYLLQVSVTLDSDLCENIAAEGASITDAGSDEKITYVINPGTEADLEISADVENFEMDDIMITGAAAQEMAVSFLSDQNEHIKQTTFIMSAEGVTIPDEKEEVVKEEKESFLDKFKSLFK